MLKGVLRDSIVYGVASVLTKGLAIFLLPIYTRVLSPADYGAFELLITLGSLANLVVALEITQGLSRYWSEISEPSKRTRLASTCLSFTIIMYMIFLIVGLLGAQQFSILLLGDSRYLLEYKLGISYIAINGVYYLMMNQLRCEMRSKSYALAGVTYALLMLVFTIIYCIWLNLGMVGVMLGQLTAVVFASLLCLWLLRNTFFFQFDIGMLCDMLRFSAPLVPAGLAVFISLYINRFALNHFGSLEDVGHFGLGSRIAGMASLLIMGVQAALTPLVYQHYREPETPGQIARLFSWFMSLALVGCLFLSLFARELLLLFSTSDFMVAAALVGVLAPSLLLSQLYIFAPGIAIQKKTHWQLGVTLISAVVSVVANWFLVPIWGIWGAALATLMSSLVFFLCWLYLSQLLYRIPYVWRSLVPACLMFISLAVAGSMLDNLMIHVAFILSFKFIFLIALVGCVVAFGLLSWTDLRYLYSFLKVHILKLSY